MSTDSHLVSLDHTYDGYYVAAYADKGCNKIQCRKFVIAATRQEARVRFAAANPQYTRSFILVEGPRV